MDRPSKEQVDNILRAHREDDDCNPDSVQCMLAAEVKALREDNEWRMRELREARAELDQLRALRMLVIAYKRDCDDEHADAYDSRCELFDAL